MVDEPIKHPMDAIEMREATRVLAVNCRTLYVELVEQGFQPHEALKLTGQWIVGVMGSANG